MRNFRNNFRRSRYKNHSDRNNHKNENGSKIINDLQNGSNFIRKNSNRNNHNASKLSDSLTDKPSYTLGIIKLIVRIKVKRFVKKIFFVIIIRPLYVKFL